MDGEEQFTYPFLNHLLSEFDTSLTNSIKILVCMGLNQISSTVPAVKPDDVDALYTRYS
jgi:hypothetical protein